jgi:hypothetical protein
MEALLSKAFTFGAIARFRRENHEEGDWGDGANEETTWVPENTVNGSQFTASPQ